MAQKTETTAKAEVTLGTAVKCGKSVLLFGGAGAGKSVLAEKLGMKISRNGKTVSIFRRHRDRRCVPSNLTVVDDVEAAAESGIDCLIVDDLDSTCVEALGGAMRRHGLQVVATVHGYHHPHSDIVDRLRSQNIDINILDHFHMASDVDWRESS